MSEKTSLCDAESLELRGRSLGFMLSLSLSSRGKSGN